jgi:uncharacterized membrane protein YphA (DoxX/SURF4 family)
LLLLRLVIGSSLVLSAVRIFDASDARAFGSLISSVTIALVGVAVVLGLLTPFAGSMAATINVLSLVSWGPAFANSLAGRPVTTGIELAVVSISLALLGPGAFSMDARLFGRREIIIPDIP